MIRNLKGFLILEAVMTVALIAGGLVLTFSAFSQTRSRSAESWELFRAALQIQTELFNYERGGTAPSSVRKEVRPNEDVLLRVSTEKSAPDMAKLRIQATDPSGQKKRTEIHTFYLSSDAS